MESQLRYMTVQQTSSWQVLLVHPDVSNTKNGLINYDYFNLTDATISLDHFEFSGVPVCNAIEANYFQKQNLCFDSMRQLENYLLIGIQKGQTDFYFKMADEGHKMADIIMAARSFAIAEASNGTYLAKVFKFLFYIFYESFSNFVF